MDVDARAHEIGDDAGLEVREGQHQLRFQRQDLRDVC
ncbi:hypothetical protein ACVWZR_009266 [Bradyrhizobium sp. i1.3.1]